MSDFTVADETTINVDDSSPRIRKMMSGWQDIVGTVVCLSILDLCILGYDSCA